LTQHQKFSGKDLTYFDEESKTRFLPHIMETSVGVARMMLAFIDNAYTKEILEEDKIISSDVGLASETSSETILSSSKNQRIVLKLDNRLSPVKVAILPLSKKEELTTPAREI
jgi:glycyl-tRNA synthetase